MAARIRNVCLIHSSLGPTFAGLGIAATNLDPPAGVVSLPQLLAGLPEPPDCVIHHEHLGKRVILTDTDAAPCPVLFWAHDPHLNFFWQRHYARLFDAAASTQPRQAGTLAAAGSPRTVWITWSGQVRPFVPFAARSRDLAFVGRTTPQRRRRIWFAEHLAAAGLVPCQDAYGPELAAVYDDARACPNECIAGEVNLRLFEAASSGCLPVSERQPPEVETLFVPGTEALYYENVLELDEHLHFLKARPRVAEAMGRAAHAAVAARHLPRHRAQALLELAAGAVASPGGPATGPDAREALALTLFFLWRAGQLALPGPEIWERLSAAPPTPPVAAALLHTAADLGNRDLYAHLAGACLGRPELRADAHVAAVACLAGYRLGDHEAARRAYAAFVGATGKTRAARLDDPFDALVFFAAALEAVGRDAARGMAFDPGRQTPDNAAECLIAAKVLRPEALEPDRRLAAILRRHPGTQAERLGLLSNLSLHRPADWSLGLELALVNLTAFRREPGIEEAMAAAQTAMAQGQAARFARRLAAADSTGRLVAALAERGVSVLSAT
ncbi:MAG: hypothetical protein B193_1078 [Solidesulfovibrio magneticus str. Maddingley MBC34]|uniref:Spore protein YkvP/CgeB glycosyl transferase-like domain-containing protein n=1 Tax=Solidesulfovibrio magneticus str. Maddingley MBC34 TaxID=1206767 RepID=K6HCK7_9BACT|nr:MAG: hypothetical protein B193_1078 [Solidesulfovibrio magneticus str. Maddingley MBC34]